MTNAHDKNASDVHELPDHAMLVVQRVFCELMNDKGQVSGKKIHAALQSGKFKGEEAGALVFLDVFYFDTLKRAGNEKTPLTGHDIQFLTDARAATLKTEHIMNLLEIHGPELLNKLDKNRDAVVRPSELQKAPADSVIQDQELLNYLRKNYAVIAQTADREDGITLGDIQKKVHDWRDVCVRCYPWWHDVMSL
jgi:hypothetical protein